MKWKVSNDKHELGVKRETKLVIPKLFVEELSVLYW